MANTIAEILGVAGSIAKGMGVTLKEMMSPTITENYPDEPPTLEERFRGVHVLQRDANGLEKCVACFLCAAACPGNQRKKTACFLQLFLPKNRRTGSTTSGE